MALGNVSFTRGQGGLGRPLPGKDHISGLVVWKDISGTSALSDPLSATGGHAINELFSVNDLEAKGIKEDTTDYQDVHYHVEEYFRLQPKGVLWLMVVDATSPNGASTPYQEIQTLVDQAGGEIRQVGVYAPSAGTSATSLAFATAELDKVQTVMDSISDDHKPAVALTAFDHSGTASGGMSSIDDLTALSNPEVASVISQDGAARGKELFSGSVNLGYSITDLGAKLGAVSFANVHENISWVAKFNMSNGTELDVPAFANGDLLTDYASTALDTIDGNHHLFLRTFVGIEGSYNNYSHTATAATSDYATLENNRTIQKAIRNSRTFLLPKLSSPIEVNADGTLSDDVVEDFKATTARALATMEQNGEVSAYSVSIDPTQDVLATSKVEITIKIVPIGVAREIDVTIGFTTSTS